MYIVIAPYSQKLRNGLVNPKNYAYWPNLVKLLEKKHKLVQVGVNGEIPLVKDTRFNLPLKELKTLIQGSSTWISVDSFLPHLAKHVNKPGVVLWGKSDPNIFGYPENLNIIKDRKYLRPNQFDIWEAETFDASAFVEHNEVYRLIKTRVLLKS